MNWLLHPLLELRRRFNNARALSRLEVNLWVDDDLLHRPAPRGWYWATSTVEAWDVLVSHYVVDCSLDHDLGPGGEVYDLVKKLEEAAHCGLNFWPVLRPTVHSQNPVGRDNIEATMNRSAPYPKRPRRRTP